MAAGTYDFTDDARLEQGSHFVRDFEYRDSNGALVDLTDYEFLMQIRSSVRSPEVLLELSTANGGFTVIGLGVVRMEISEAIAETMDWRRGVHGIEAKPPGGQGELWLEGDVEAKPTAVHPA